MPRYTCTNCSAGRKNLLNSVMGVFKRSFLGLHLGIPLHSSEERMFIAIPSNLVKISEYHILVLRRNFSSHECWANPFFFKNKCNFINFQSCRFHSVAVNAKGEPQRVAG